MRLTINSLFTLGAPISLMNMQGSFRAEGTWDLSLSMNNNTVLLLNVQDLLRDWVLTMEQLLKRAPYSSSGCSAFSPLRMTHLSSQLVEISLQCWPDCSDEKDMLEIV